jgi:hypothetical protein
LLERAIRDGAGGTGAQALSRMRPLNVYQIVRRAAGGITDKAGLAVGALPSSAHHHALADARTLRWVCEAACDRRSTARPSTRPALAISDRPHGQSAWTGKPAGVIGASPGPSGTAMAQQHLRNVLVCLDVPTLCQPEAFVQLKTGLFEADGQFGAGSKAFFQGWMDRYVAWVTHHAA